MSRCAHPTAFSARFRADRRPYRRAQNDVSTSIMPRTGSSVSSLPSRTTIQLPWAPRAASTSSVFILPSRSRCSTAITATAGPASSRRALALVPFIPDPTSASTLTTGRPACAAHADRRATWRPRSAFWSCEDTRAYRPAPPCGDGAAAVPGDTRISRPTFCAGTGSVPSRYQRYAVVTWMPCACAHSVRFTRQAYSLEHAFAIQNTLNDITGPTPRASLIPGQQQCAGRRETSAADHGHVAAGDLPLPGVAAQLHHRLLQQSHAVGAPVRELPAVRVDRQDAVACDVLAAVEEVLCLADAAEAQCLNPGQAVERVPVVQQGDIDVGGRERRAAPEVR